MKSTLMEYLIPINPAVMLEQIHQLNLDKYVKKLDCITARLFIFAPFQERN
jgi:hypothetical protein